MTGANEPGITVLKLISLIWILFGNWHGCKWFCTASVTKKELDLLQEKETGFESWVCICLFAYIHKRLQNLTCMRSTPQVRISAQFSFPNMYVRTCTVHVHVFPFLPSLMHYASLWTWWWLLLKSRLAVHSHIVNTSILVHKFSLVVHRYDPAGSPQESRSVRAALLGTLPREQTWRLRTKEVEEAGERAAEP
jgi:hypothetical protein